MALPGQRASKEPGCNCSRMSITSNGWNSNIDLDVQQAVNNYTNALATLDNQKRNMELAEQVYNQTRLKFQKGVGSNTEITSAQNDLPVAQNNYILALYDAINAKIDFLKATGKLQ